MAHQSVTVSYNIALKIFELSRPEVPTGKDILFAFHHDPARILSILKEEKEDVYFRYNDEEASVVRVVVENLDLADFTGLSNSHNPD
jgi:phage terminase large subunit